jgi:hypothetical protein
VRSSPVQPHGGQCATGRHAIECQAPRTEKGILSTTRDIGVVPHGSRLISTAESVGYGFTLACLPLYKDDRFFPSMEMAPHSRTGSFSSVGVYVPSIPITALQIESVSGQLAEVEQRRQSDGVELRRVRDHVFARRIVGAPALGRRGLSAKQILWTARHEPRDPQRGPEAERLASEGEVSADRLQGFISIAPGWVRSESMREFTPQLKSHAR